MLFRSKTDSVFISRISLLPTWVFKGKINGKTQFKILPSEITKDTLKFLTNDDINKMNNAFYDVKNVVTSKDSSIVIQNLY